MSSHIKEFELRGLDCASCAAKIEHGVQAIPEVKQASVNFALAVLSIEAHAPDMLESAIEKAKRVVHRHEPDILIQERTQATRKQESHDHSGYDHDHGHSHDHGGAGMPFSKRKAAALIFGILVFVAAMALKPAFPANLLLFLAAYLLIGGEVLLSALQNIRRGQIFDENFLMSLATVGAFAIGEYPEGVAVMLFYQVGEFFQELAVRRSRKSISALMDIRPDYANLLRDGATTRVSPEEVHIGALILVRPGEKIPLDGVVTEGFSALDTSALTGESMPRDVQPGSSVLSGSINKSGALTIRVEKEFGESTVSKILRLVESAGSKKASTENFITKFARYYTPAVVVAAALLAFVPPLVIEGATFAHWINRALVFLVISCPCALVISIPLGFFGGIGGASSRGILIKGSAYLEALAHVDTVVFDKTGTLTQGLFKVTGVHTRGRLSQNELLQTAAIAESRSTHPIAQSILREYGSVPDTGTASDYTELPGRGIRVDIGGREVLAGNTRLLSEHGITASEPDSGGTRVYLAVDGRYEGYIQIEDEIKPDTREAIEKLRAQGIRRIVMLTGDSAQAGESVAAQVGLDKAYTQLLPDAKVAVLEELQSTRSTKGKLVFVGDGINDAPVLARADIGVAMGGVGSDAAIEAADVVLMTDEPAKLVSAINISRRTRRIVMQNIVFALGVKAVILVLGAYGIATMWMAVFGDVGVALIAILNSMRALRTGKV